MDVVKSRNLSLTKRGMNFETFMWLYTRVSALAIYGLILVGLIGALIMGAQNEMNFAEVMRWAFNPNVHHAHSTDVVDLGPYQGRFWKLVASLLLLAVASHGVHGLIEIGDDYITSERGRKIIRWLNILAILVVSVMGFYLIWRT